MDSVTPRRRALLSVAADLVVVLVFVAIGRSIHGHGDGWRGLVSTTWPFATGVALGWLVIARQRRNGESMRDGAVVCLVTVVVGMVVRVVAGQGTAAAFIAVATGFFGASMIGWRLVLSEIRRHREKP